MSPNAPIIIHDSDSESEPSPRAAKRQKLEKDITMIETNPLMKLMKKNDGLKGRRRFTADLNDVKEATENGIAVRGLKLRKVRPGDDEGAIEVFIAHSDGDNVMSLSLLISDTSDYPRSHTFFSYALEPVDSKFQDIIENIANEPSKTIAETIDRLCATIANVLGIDNWSLSQDVDMEERESDDGDDEENDGSDYEAFDEFEEPSSGPKTSHISDMLIHLHSDFLDTVASGYRPGMIRFGADDFCLSVSIPVITLAESISPRALVAWDRRLLSRSQHLTLLISGFRGVYPSVGTDGKYTPSASHSGTQLSFRIGLTARYKPGVENAREAIRTFGLITEDAEDLLRMEAEKAAEERALQELLSDNPEDVLPLIDTPEVEDLGRFDKFSLSNSLESLMEQGFLKILQYRREFKLGWAGAEKILAEVEKTQMKADDIFRQKKKDILLAEEEERELARTNVLPHDPLADVESEINMPLTAFCYLVRRLTLCTRFCIVCHNKLTSEFEALKPYVCDNKLCQYQYYSLNKGPSLEYEIIHNPQTVDLLLSITFQAAVEGILDDPFPVGIGLRVQMPDNSKIIQPPQGYLQSPHPASFGQVATPPPIPLAMPVVGSDGLVDFDSLNPGQMRVSIVELIDSLPSIDDMRKHLMRKSKPGRSKPKLKDADPTALPAAWGILRWCIGSCTAYLEEVGLEERIQGMDPLWRQYRFSVGSPDAEAKFQSAVAQAKAYSPNAVKYPSLFAFHGSPLRNWHSIIRHGLWYKTIANGRAYGNGVYLAREGQISMGSYTNGSRCGGWHRSKVCPLSCVALAEVVNLPEQFVSSNPYYVIPDTTWIQCRYLLVKGTALDDDQVSAPTSGSSTSTMAKGKKRKEPTAQNPIVKLDPANGVSLNGNAIAIPEPGYQIDLLLDDRRAENVIDEPDYEDISIFNCIDTGGPTHPISINGSPGYDMMDVDDPTPGRVTKPADDWKHDKEWVAHNVTHILPPPDRATPAATVAVQRELRSMLKEQETCSSLRELGWYMPPDHIGDNLFQWIVEMHSFDPDLPIAKDLQRHNINSLLIEIRFPPDYPIAPPFFRIITPRFLPFIHGGGGHITGGGSICMDLLTSDGWLPSYSISAVLLQIKLAISNLDPRPARLASDWHRYYTPGEALEGFKRAAKTHNWRVPDGLDRLVR